MPLSGMPCGFEDSLLDFESSIALNAVAAAADDPTAAAAAAAAVESADDWVVQVADFDPSAALKTEPITSHITTGFYPFLILLLLLDDVDDDDDDDDDLSC